MSLHSVAFVLAGAIGMGVAVIHGVLLQKHIVLPFAAWASASHVRRSTRTLAPALVQFSTYNWFAGGLALMAAPFWSDHDGKLVTCLLVGSSYLYGALANLWATRGRHPGWMLYAVALLLIGYAVSEG